MTAKTDTPTKILKKSPPSPPAQEKYDDWQMFEKCYLAALTGLTSQAEVQLDISEGRGDWHAESDETLTERDQFLADRAADIATLSVEVLRREKQMRIFNSEV